MPSLKTRLSQVLPKKFRDSLRKPTLEQKSVHEEKLRDYFSAFHLPKSTVALDRPVCIMLFTNRSRSNAIGDYLRASLRFTGFAESLNYRRILKHAEQNKLREFATYLQWEVSQIEFDESRLTMRVQRDDTNVRFKKRFIEDYNSQQSSGIHPAP